MKTNVEELFVISFHFFDFFILFGRFLFSKYLLFFCVTFFLCYMKTKRRGVP